MRKQEIEKRIKILQSIMDEEKSMSIIYRRAERRQAQLEVDLHYILMTEADEYIDRRINEHN